MRIDNQRRSSNVQDRGRGGGGGGGLGGGMPVRLGGMSLTGLIIVGIILFLLPADIRNQILNQVTGGGGSGVTQSTGAGVCEAQAERCDQLRAVLGSTEDVWNEQFPHGNLPQYARTLPTDYADPTLVVFEGQVETGCGVAPSSVGPFYCPADSNLYIDPSFYDVMAQRLNSPGDFAQAYVIAHEVAHHIQNLIGATQAGPNESENQHSVRVELQADCLAGVWGHSARASLAIDDADLREALNAAHNIGDDTLQRQGSGYVNPNQFTHGTSEQRMRWFRRGFDSGDGKQCDTMQGAYSAL